MATIIPYRKPKTRAEALIQGQTMRKILRIVQSKFPGEEKMFFAQYDDFRGIWVLYVTDFYKYMNDKRLNAWKKVIRKKYPNFVWIMAHGLLPTTATMLKGYHAQRKPIQVVIE